MPVTTIDSLTALANFGKSPVARWPSRETTGNRLEVLAAPVFDATFRIGRGAKIVSIGACFARQIASALESRGFDIPTRWLGDAGMDGTDADTEAGRLMYYTYGVPAIYNEIAWAFGELPYDPQAHVVEVRPGLYADMHLARNLPLEPLDQVVARRERIFETTRSLMTADVLIVTLGRAEVWFDHKANTYLNVRPLDIAIRRDPGRFSCHVLSYDEVKQFLERTFEIIFRRCRPELRVLLGVSPVPQSTTSLGGDVVVANSHAKSVLRAVSEAIVKSSDRIDYFPCYESVTLSDRDLAFEDDQVHVRPALVDHIVCATIDAYTDGLSSKRMVDLDARERPTVAQTAALRQAQDHCRERRYEEAFDAAEAVRHGPCAAAALRVQATAKLRMDELDEAERLARAALAIRHNEAGLHALLAEALMALERFEEAETHLQRALNYTPDQARWTAMLDSLRGRRKYKRRAAAKRSRAAPDAKSVEPAAIVGERRAVAVAAGSIGRTHRRRPVMPAHAEALPVAAAHEHATNAAPASGRRRIVFHVGLPHSGTTAFQHFCHSHRRFLGRNDIHYLRSARGFGHRHSPIVASYIAHRPVGPTVAFRWRSRAETVRAIKKEIAKSRSQTTLISSEHFSMHFDRAEAQALAADFAEYDCTIVCVVRDMHARLLSGFNTHVTASGCVPFEQYARTVLSAGTRHLSACETIKVWEEAFGRAQMRLVDYDATADVTAAILGVCGLRGPLPRDASTRRRASLAPEAVRVLRAANVLIAERQTIKIDRGAAAWVQHAFFSDRCRRRLMRYAGGAGWTLSAKATKILDRSAEADRRYIAEAYRMILQGDTTRTRLTVCDQPTDEAEETRRAQALVAGATRGLWAPSAGLARVAFWCTSAFKRMASGLPDAGAGLAPEPGLQVQAE